MCRIVAVLAAILSVVVQTACTTQTRTVLYAAIGPELDQYDLDLNAATLTKRSSVTVPENVQEAAVLEAAPSGKVLYAAWSDGGPVNGVIPPGPAPPSRHQRFPHRSGFRSSASAWRARYVAVAADLHHHGYDRHSRSHRSQQSKFSDCVQNPAGRNTRRLGSTIRESRFWHLRPSGSRRSIRQDDHSDDTRQRIGRDCS